MANIKFGNGWADARGKVGGVIYSKNKGGSYARNYTKPTNPRTPAQVAQRNRFSFVSTNWRLLTEQERNAWNYSASQVTFSNKVGERIHLTGAQYFGKQNLNIFSAGGTTIVTSPSELVDIIGVVSGSVVATVTAGAVSAIALSAVLVDGTTVVPSGSTAEIYATPALSQGVTRPQEDAYSYIFGVDEGDPLTAVAVLGEYTGTYPPPADGANVWFKVRILNQVTGQASQEYEMKMTYVTA